jgi:hypothetical protein
MSRASWYRHGKPQKKPKRETLVVLSQHLGLSVRTLQRLHRVWRASDEFARLVEDGQMSIGRAERLLRKAKARKPITGDGFLMLRD